MSFYGNQIIETNKAFSSILVQPSYIDTNNYTELKSTIQDCPLILAPMDPWIGADVQINGGDNNKIFVFHTSTAQRFQKNNMILAGGAVEDQIFENPKTYIDNYCNKYNFESYDLKAGDSFITIAPVDSTKEVIIDNAGHLLNAKLVKYNLPTTIGFSYDKDPWVQTIYGTDGWYSENSAKYHIDESNIGLIPDLYKKISQIQANVSGETVDLTQLNQVTEDIKKLKVQVKNLYYPDDNWPDTTLDINKSPLSEALISIRDCQLAERDSRTLNILSNSKYRDTPVIQILQAIKDCNYTDTFINSSVLLKDEIKLLQLLEKFDNLRVIIESFFGLEWDNNISMNPIRYIETEVSEVEFNANPSLYFKQIDNRFVPADSFDISVEKYFTRVNKNLIVIEMNSEIFNANKQNLYIRGDLAGSYYIHPTTYNPSSQVFYYIYTGYTEQSCKNVLDAVECYSGGTTTETITAYIQKLNSAR